MTVRFLLDTDIASYVMKRSSPPLLEKLRTVPVGEIAISVITLAELLYGVELSPRREHDEAALRGLLRLLHPLDLPESTASHYAAIRADLRRRGEMIGGNDLWIAAHARSLGLVLVTNNTREFGRVEGLAIENWAA